MSFGVFLSFLAAAISGIILYLRPEGSLAAWTGWNAFGIDKKGWEGLHIVSIAMFVLFAVAHIQFTWRVLIGYIRRKAADGKLLWKELAAALFIVLLILAGAVTRRGPVWRLVDLRSQVKEGIHLVKVGPPVPNAQDMPIAELCALIHVTPETAVANLEKAGYPVADLGATLTDLAERGKTSPEKLYSIIIKR